MISLHSGEFLYTTVKELLIPSDKVAHVQIGNNIEHALLVLIKTGYTAIPVLDSQYKLHGLISKTLILDGILGLERIEFERLETIKVQDVMNKEIPRLHLKDKVEKGLELVVDHPFVCVENEDGFFEGIFTRREILKRLDRHIKKLNN
ncbi:CBS domain-containing protein [Bacillus timonensis]|nr:CBS domain-containing protein [Bacillus timonensis]